MKKENFNIIAKPPAYAWLVFIISASFLFYKYILQISPAVMTSELMKAYSLSGTGLGFLVGFYFYTYMIMQIPSGILLDKYGTRLLTGIAILLCAIGTLLFAQAHSFALACFARLLIGFGAAFATTSYMKISSQWFPSQYFALLSGLFGTACMAGAGTAEAPIAWLINHIEWRNTLLICAIAGFILFILFWLIVAEKRNPQLLAENSRAEKFNFKQFFALFKNRSNIPLIFYGGLAFTPASVFGGLWGVPYIVAAYHLPKATAASIVSLVFFGFAIGGILIGFLGKQMKRQLPLVVGGTILAMFFLTLVILIPHMPIWLLDSCIFLFGLSSSGFLLSYTIAKNINSVALFGTVIGVINMGDPLCGAIADPLVGKILDLNWQGITVNNARIFSVHAFQLALSVLIGYLLLALLCCYFIKEKQVAELNTIDSDLKALNTST